MERISFASQVAMLVTFIVAVGVPVALFFIVAIKKRAEKLCFIIGAVAFIIFALILESILHRIVISVFGDTLLTNTAFMAIYGGLAAGVFEETGRLVAMKTVMKKHLTKENALMYGVGHGGAESIIIIGLTYISNLITSVMINTGAMEPMLSGLDETVKAQTMEQFSILATTAPLDFYMAGLERVSAIALHICLSYLVYLAVKNRKYGFYCLSILIHAGFDAITVALSKTMSIYVLEIVLLVLVVILACFVYRAYQKEPVMEVQAD